MKAISTAGKIIKAAPKGTYNIPGFVLGRLETVVALLKATRESLQEAEATKAADATAHALKLAKAALRRAQRNHKG